MCHFSVAGRSLSSLSMSQILLNPDVTEAHKLRGWYDEVGHTMDYSEFQGDGSSGAGGGEQLRLQ